MKKKLIIAAFLISISSHGQTFFETADDDGIINLADKKRVSQIKLSPSSTSIAYGYNYASGGMNSNYKFVINGNIKVKPNEEGIAILAEEGKLQPGVKGDFSTGIRFNDNFFDNNWSILDLSFKTEYEFNYYSIVDATRIDQNLDPYYKKSKNSYGLNVLANYGMAIGKIQTFLGFQIGYLSTNNGDDLPDGSYQTHTQYGENYLVSDAKQVKIGTLKDIEKYPVKLDFILDTGLYLGKQEIAVEDKENEEEEGSVSNIKLGFFSYYRTDLKVDKPVQRLGFGLCFLDNQNPSKIFSSIGYELPKFGSGIAEDNDDKGIVFLSIGYTIM